MRDFVLESPAGMGNYQQTGFKTSTKRKELMRQRPVSVLIFGILNIGFGLLGLVRPLFPTSRALEVVKADPDFVKWTDFNTMTGAVFGAALLAFGIGLLLLQNWARLGSVIYAIIAIVYVPITSMVGWPYMKQMIEHQMMQAQKQAVSPGMIQGIAMIGLIIGLIFGLAYPVLLLIFMTRSKAIEACQSQPEQPAPSA